MTERMSPTEVLSGAEAALCTTHRTSDGSDHSLVVDNTVISVHANIALQTLNNEISAALNGSAAKNFIPEAIEFVGISASGSPNGDAIITAGTSAGGTQLVGVTSLTGLNSAGGVFRINLTGYFAPILGNATLYVKCTTADTKGGASTNVVTARIVGRQVSI